MHMEAGGETMNANNARKKWTIIERALVLLPLLVLSAVVAQAQVFYVRQGAVGTRIGANWTNAYLTLPATLVRGATYYVADGAYGDYVFDDPERATLAITIKKATATDHGANTGWEASFGDGTAEFTNMTFYTGYYVVNGQYGSWGSAYGFRVKPPATRANAKAIAMYGDPAKNRSAHDIVLAYIDVQENGEDNGANSDDAIYMIGTSTHKVYNITVAGSWIHDTNRTLILARGVHHVSFEYNVIEKRHTTSTVHGELLSLDSSGSVFLTFRYNLIKDVYGTGMLVIGLDHASVHSDIDIYGNLFLMSDPTRYGVSNGIITCSTGNTVNNARIFNNTFAFNSTGLNALGIVYFSKGTGNLAYNNIIYRPSKPARWMNVSHDYNSYYEAGAQSETNQFVGYGDPFQNVAAYDFRLRASTVPGFTLEGLYSRDLTGALRGADGNWDRGAYEFSGSGAAVPEAPSNMRVKY